MVDMEAKLKESYSDTLYYTFLSYSISALFQSKTTGTDVAVLVG